MAPAPVAFVFIAILGAVLALWALAIQRRTPRDRAVPRTMLSTSHVGRVVFGTLAVVFVVVGIAAQSGVAVAFGVALILAAAGQHWVHEQWRS